MLAPQALGWVRQRQLTEEDTGRTAQVALNRDRLPVDPEEFRRRPTENLDPVRSA